MEESYHLASNVVSNSTAVQPTRAEQGAIESKSLGTYGGMVVGLFFLCLLSVELFFVMTIVASRTLHDNMLSTLIRAPMYFFDNNSIGEGNNISDKNK